MSLRELTIFRTYVIGPLVGWKPHRPQVPCAAKIYLISAKHNARPPFSLSRSKQVDEGSVATSVNPLFSSKGSGLVLLFYGGQTPEPTLTFRLRETVLWPSVAFTVPTCLVTTGEVATLKAGLTVCPAGIKTDAGT